MRSGRPIKIMVLALAGALYLAGAVRQRDAFNLSATAGGQAPYLLEAIRMHESWTGIDDPSVSPSSRAGLYLGDRNRMPLVPMALSPVYRGDLEQFVRRSSWFAIISGLVLLIAGGATCCALLPTVPAVIIVLLAAVHVFLPKSSFVQAELAYYAFFFLAWLAMCRVIVRPSARWAAVAGALGALAYLAKASGLLLIILFLLAMAARILIDLRRKPGGAGAAPPRAGASLTAALVAGLIFLAVSFPYIYDTKVRFGRWFYNVNSTFFMWCDSWAEAKAFADQHQIHERFPEAPALSLPSLSRYANTHTVAQILQRFRYGFSSLGQLAWKSAYAKHLFVLFALALFAGRKRALWSNLTAAHWIRLLFFVGMFISYLLVYAWFAVIAHGDRFLLSLYLPSVFTVLWVFSAAERAKAGLDMEGHRLRYDGAAACS